MAPGSLLVVFTNPSVAFYLRLPPGPLPIGLFCFIPVIRFIDQTRFHGGRVTPRERIRTAVQDLGSPATLTAETLGSDPVTQAHMNTALANTCAFIDTVNTEVQAILRLFVDEFRLSPGNQILSNRLEAAINAFD